MSFRDPHLRWLPIRQRPVWRRRWKALLDVAPFLILVAALVVAIPSIFKFNPGESGTGGGNTPAASKVETPTIAESVLPKNVFWKRRKTAPNGTLWPQKSDYVAGYPRLNVAGIAEVTVDNSGGTSDMFVKLVDRDAVPLKAVRVVFVKAGESKTLGRVKPGNYDLRYQDLDSGVIFRCDPFAVTVTKEEDGDVYQGWTIGLYGTVDGNSTHTEISEREF